MGNVALDASAMLAVILNEPGGDMVGQSLGEAVVSAVNLSEVVAKLTGRGASEPEVRTKLREIEVETVPFDAEQAMTAGLMYRQTSRGGLSLGDRACLGLAMVLGVPVMTTDRVWADLDLGVEVRLIR